MKPLNKVLNVLGYIAFAIFSLILLVSIIASISIGYYFFAIFILVIYSIILFMLYAKLNKKRYQQPVILQNSQKQTETIKLSNDVSIPYEYDDDTDLESIDDDENYNDDFYNSGYGDWKVLSFGYGQYIALTGTSFGDRQKNILQLKSGDRLKQNYFQFKNTPAIEVFINELSIGFIPKELANEFTLLKDYCNEVVVKDIIGGDDGKYYGVIVDYRINNNADEILKSLYEVR